MSYTASNIGELLDRVDEIERLWAPDVNSPQEIWFRGQERQDHNLLPSLYRKEQFNGEGTLFERFKALAVPFVSKPVSDEWDWYFLARHHGVPTRLLDWTESLLTATYFAIAKRILGGTRLEVDAALAKPPSSPIFDQESPVVWLLDAGTLNAYSGGPGDDIVITPGGPVSNLYLPGPLEEEMVSQNELPLAILPPRGNARLVAQRGLFTLHGHSRTPLEQLSPRADGRVPSLAAVVLDRANLYHLWSQLQTAGVDRLSMFPDLDSVAQHVCWTCRVA